MEVLVPTSEQIKQTVLQYFQQKNPNANENTNLTQDLGLDPRQILDIGTQLAEELNCFPTRSQILACKTIGALIQLLVSTVTQVVRGIPHSPPPPPAGAAASRAKQSTKPKGK
jgi:acyl carrier protein